MKLILTFLILSFLIVEKAMGQEINVIKANKYKIEKIENDKKITGLEGDVSLTVKNFEIFQADSVIIGEQRDKIIIFGHSEFSFKGKIVYLDNVKNERRYLEYNIGKETLYIK